MSVQESDSKVERAEVVRAVLESVRARNALIAEGVEELNFVLSSMAKSVPAHIEFDDLVMEAVVKIIEAADRFNPEHSSKASFSSYVSRSIRGVIVEYLRDYGANGRHYVYVEEAAANGHAYKFSDGLLGAKASLARACVSAMDTECLDVEDRVLIALRFYWDQSVRDIASRTGLAASTVNRKINAALEKLRVENFLAIRKRDKEKKAVSPS